MYTDRQTNLNEGTHCQYNLLESGVHCFHAHHATRRAVDEYLNRLGELFEDHPEDDTPFRFLVDLRPAGMPPFAYTMQQTRAFLRTHTVPQRVRVVYLHHNDPILHTMAVFLRAMYIRSERLILNGDREEEAVSWLLSDQPAQRSVRIR